MFGGVGPLFCVRLGSRYCVKKHGLFACVRRFSAIMLCAFELQVMLKIIAFWSVVTGSGP